MKYTKNYHLPQWAESDRIMMDDFNAAMENIEGGLSTAQAAANSAAEEAANLPYAAGTYTGDGKTMAQGGQFIELGFRPRFIIISRGWWSTSYSGDCFLVAGESRIPQLDELFVPQDSGFVVANRSSGYLTLNTSGITYSFIAFQ